MRQTFEFATAEGSIRIERTYQEINMDGPVADEAWRFTDSQGHEHAYSAAKDPEAERGGHYPTLVYAVALRLSWDEIERLAAGDPDDRAGEET